MLGIDGHLDIDGLDEVGLERDGDDFEGVRDGLLDEGDVTDAGVGPGPQVGVDGFGGVVGGDAPLKASAGVGHAFGSSDGAAGAGVGDGEPPAPAT
jgi:hypothetical protein